MDEIVEDEPRSVVGPVLHSELILDEAPPFLAGLGKVVRYAAELMLPLVAITTFDRLFTGTGLVLEAGLAITLWYAFWVARRVLRRGRDRQRDFDDPHDEVEELSDFPGDFVSALVLVLVATWVGRGAFAYLEAGYDGFGWMLWTVAGVVGFTGCTSLREGVFRVLAHGEARRRLELWEPDELLADDASDGRARTGVAPTDELDRILEPPDLKV